MLAVPGLALLMALFVHQAQSAPAVRQLTTYESPQQYGKLLKPSAYFTVNGTFVQDDPATNATTYNVYAQNASLGLVGGNWTNFTNYVADLNANADENTSYKVIFIARHGEGYHNVAESTYTTPLWNCYWSLVNGNGSSEWGPDALLTPNGIAQAQIASASWTQNLQAGAPFPQTFISSPLSRAASTLNITWSDKLGSNVPTFKEIWRESIGLHTCDRRRNATYLQATYPAFDFEEGFSQTDELWGPTLEETGAQQANRIRRALDELFESNPNVFISITAHSGCITGLLASIGHRAWSTQTGGLVPVLIRASNATVIATPSAGPSQTAPPCTSTVAASSVISVAPNPSSIPTTAPLSGSGVPSDISASASPTFTGYALYSSASSISI